MGTRINVLFDHDLTDHRDREAVLSRLAPTLTAALAVRDYWLEVASKAPSRLEREAIRQEEELMEWQAEPFGPRDKGVRRYEGPGSLFLTVTAQAVTVHTGGRWRGFLSIEPLRQVHLRAFHVIARALGGRRLVYFPDNDFVYDLFWDGKTQAECIALLERMRGPPQPSIESIDPKIVQGTEDGVPSVWYLETISTGA